MPEDVGDPPKAIEEGDPPKAIEEASAAMRRLARITRDMHVALCAEGFTEAQAIDITSRFLIEALRGGRQ